MTIFVQTKNGQIGILIISEFLIWMRQGAINTENKNIIFPKRGGGYLYVKYWPLGRAVDPHSFFADPNPAAFFIADLALKNM